MALTSTTIVIDVFGSTCVFNNVRCMVCCLHQHCRQICAACSLCCFTGQASLRRPRYLISRTPDTFSPTRGFTVLQPDVYIDAHDSSTWTADQVRRFRDERLCQGHMSVDFPIFKHVSSLEWFLIRLSSAHLFFPSWQCNWSQWLTFACRKALQGFLLEGGR